MVLWLSFDIYEYSYNNEHYSFHICIFQILSLMLWFTQRPKRLREQQVNVAIVCSSVLELNQYVYKSESILCLSEDSYIHHITPLFFFSLPFFISNATKSVPFKHVHKNFYGFTTLSVRQYGCIRSSDTESHESSFSPVSFCKNSMLKTFIVHFFAWTI